MLDKLCTGASAFIFCNLIEDTERRVMFVVIENDGQ